MAAECRVQLLHAGVDMRCLISSQNKQRARGCKAGTDKDARRARTRRADAPVIADFVSSHSEQGRRRLGPDI